MRNSNSQIGLGYRFSIINRFEKEANSLFDRMSVKPTIKRAKICSDLIKDLKGYGIWIKLDALYVLAAHSEQAGLLNWISNSNNATASGSPTFTSDEGFTFNGSSNYLDTNWNPNSHASNYSMDDACVGVYVRNNVAEDATDIGWYDSASANCRTLIRSRNAGDEIRAYIHNVTANDVGTITNSRGLTVINQIDDLTLRVFKNGSKIGNDISNSTPQPNFSSFTYNFFIGASNNSGSDVAHCTKQIGLALIGAALSGKHSDLHTAIEKYMDAIGAGVV